MEEDDDNIIITEDGEGDAKPIVSQEDSIAVLKKQLDDAKREAVEARKSAHENARTAYQANERAMQNDLALIEGAITEIERNDSILQQGLIVANQAGDFHRVAEIQREILNNQTKLNQLEAGRSALDAKLKEPRKEPDLPAIDPVENVASQLPERSASWIRAHPEFVKDQKKWQKLVAADSLARADDIAPESPEYFEFIERTLGIDGGRAVQKKGQVEQDEDPMSMAASTSKTRESPVVAPVSSGGGSGKGSITLTKAQAAMADELGMKREDYARNLALLQKEGRMTQH